MPFPTSGPWHRPLFVYPPPSPIYETVLEKFSPQEIPKPQDTSPSGPESLLWGPHDNPSFSWVTGLKGPARRDQVTRITGHQEQCLPLNRAPERLVE